MGERENDKKGKDNGSNSQQPEFKGAPNAAEAFSGWFDNWKPWTTIGWGIKNSIEKTFGEGAAEQGEFENLKIRLVNMASKVIGILKEGRIKEVLGPGWDFALEVAHDVEISLNVLCGLIE